VGSCATCRCRVLDGEVKALTDPGYVLTAEQIAARTVLACQSQPRSNLRLHLERAARPRPAAGQAAGE